MRASCKWCGNEITRRGRRIPVFCSVICKAEWQKTRKPISRDKLFQLYVIDGMGTYQISRLVGRHPKRVFEWLRGFGIPTRQRSWQTTLGAQPYHDREWLQHEYIDRRRSAAEIASSCSVSENNILFFLDQFRIPRRKMDDIRAHKHWGAVGAANPMYGVTGDRNPNWRGGITPERQSFYMSEEWQTVSRQVWLRDKSTCQRCRVLADAGVELHIQHKVSFANRALRACLTNLVLLCKSCHHYVHSTKNHSREFIGAWRERRITRGSSEQRPALLPPLK